MIRSGDTLHNPVTGEVIRFVTAAADTGGEYVLIEVVVEPNGAVAAAHVHPYQTEIFEILEGEVTFRPATRRSSRRRAIRFGSTPARRTSSGTRRDRRTVPDRGPARAPVRVAHRDDVRSRDDGKTNRKGMPNPLRLAVIANAHFDVVRLPFPPAWMQRVGLALGAPLGRLLGYRPTYEPAEPSEASLAL